MDTTAETGDSAASGEPANHSSPAKCAEHQHDDKNSSSGKGDRSPTQQLQKCEQLSETPATSQESGPKLQTPSSDGKAGADVEMADASDKTQKSDTRSAGYNAGGNRRNWRNNRNRNRKRKVFNRRSRPYPKTSGDWDGERPDRVNHSLNLDQEQERRANFVKMSMQKYGKPFAPYNTTQFLMEDHNVREPEFEEISKLLRLHQDQEQDGAVGAAEGQDNESFSTRDASDSEDFYSSPDDEREFQQRQFSAVYEHVHAERLSDMSKGQLVQEYVLLEQKVEELEQKLKVSQARLTDASHRTPAATASNSLATGSHVSALTHLKAEVTRLQAENQRLRCLVPLQRPHSSTSSLSSSSCSSVTTADSCTHPDGNAIPTSTSSVS